MEGGTQIMPWVRYVIAGGALLAGTSIVAAVYRIIKSTSKEPAKVTEAIAEVKQKQEELKNLYGSDIGNLLFEAEKLHAASHAYPYVRYNYQILAQENADYNTLVAIVKQLGIAETDSRVIEAKQLHESANGENYVRSPQLLQQADANYELSLTILNHLKNQSSS